MSLNIVLWMHVFESELVCSSYCVGTGLKCSSPYTFNNNFISKPIYTLIKWKASLY